MGGLGKTRLAIEAGFQLLERYSNGVWFVDLAAVADGAGVARALAAVLTVREESDKPLQASLCDALRDRSVLLVMDNCEHVLDAAARVIRSMLTECPRLHVLATSRQSLGLTGEVALRLEPLAVPHTIDPPLSQIGTVDAAKQPPAISLFVERAAAVQPSFELTPQNYAAVTAICRRLDGIPLALELAAARVRSLSVEQIAARLDDRFRLLVSGDRAAQPRQQTLRGLVDWSYDLLEPNARLLIARLSVFAGGCTLEAAEEICADSESEGSGAVGNVEARPRIEAADVLDLLTDLVEKSLVQVESGAHGDNRYLMLETLRQYAGEKLNDLGELTQLRQRHFRFYVRVAESAEAEMRGPNQNRRLREILADNDNFRAALLEASAGVDRMRLAAALFWHWYIHGLYAEGRSWIERALKECPDAPTPLLCRTKKAAGDLCWALGDLDDARKIHLQNLEIQSRVQDRRGIALSHNSLGLVAYHQGDCAASIEHYRTGLAILREEGDPTVTGLLLMNLALPIKDQGDYVEAETLLAEADELHRITGNTQGLGAVLHSRCLIAKRLGDYARAREFLEEAMEIERQQQNPHGEAVMLHTLGEIAFYQRDLDYAEECYRSALDRFRLAGAKRAIAASLYGLGQIFFERNDYTQAREYHLESLRIETDLKNRSGISNSLWGIAALDHVSGRPDRAAILLGAVAAESRQSGTSVAPNQLADRDRLLESVRDTLGEAIFTTEWQTGATLTIEQAAYLAQQS
jgi:predicted ATPase